MTAVVVEVKEEFIGRANFIDIDVNNKSETNIVNKFGISSIPTSVFFDKAGKQAGQYVGEIKKEQLIEYLTELEK